MNPLKLPQHPNSFSLHPLAVKPCPISQILLVGNAPGTFLPGKKISIL
jgi:hypothetical protein